MHTAHAWVRLAQLLLIIGLLDELAGVLFVSTPGIERDLGIGHATAMIALFTAPAMVAAVGDPPIFLLAAKKPRWHRAMVLGGLTLQGLSLLAAASAQSAWVLGAAVCVMYTASSASTGLAEITLMDSAGDDHEQWMARWAGLGAIGDLLAPLLVAAVAWIGLGWRTSVALVGLGFLVYAAFLSPRPFPPHVEDEHEPGLRESLREAWTHPTLMAWLVGVSLCSLLDETFVALAALHLEAAYGAVESTRGLILALLTGSTVLGLVATERALAAGVVPMRLLRVVALACTACFLAWWAAPDLRTSAAALLALGLCIGPLWPIAMAQAFRALPGRGAIVEVAQIPFGLFDVVLPLLIGWIADTWGLRVALLVLLAQPLGLLAISLWSATPRPGADR